MRRDEDSEGPVATLRRLLDINMIDALQIGVGILVLSSSILFSVTKHQTTPNDAPDLPAKIEKLTSLLNTSSQSIAEIEQEIAERKKLVGQLQRDAETAERLKALNSQQVEAIAQALKGELEKQERGAYWTTLGWNAFFTVLGVALAELWHYARRWRRARRMSPAE